MKLVVVLEKGNKTTVLSKYKNTDIKKKLALQEHHAPHFGTTALINLLFTPCFMLFLKFSSLG